MNVCNNNEEYLRDFFEHAPIGFHAFGPDQIIIDINETELQLLGYERDEVVGSKRWSDLIVPGNQARFKKHWQDILTYGRVINLEYTVVSKSGELFNVLLNASARFDEQGRLINTRGSVVNVTDRLAMEQKLHQKQDVMRNNIRSLRRIIRNMEPAKAEIMENVQINIQQRIFSLVEKIKQRDGPKKNSVTVTLEKNISEIISGIGSEVYNPGWNLSAREMEICFLVQSRLTTNEIAELLCSSPKTIDNHRNHIRKKLGISGKDVDLAKYLKSL